MNAVPEEMGKMFAVELYQAERIGSLLGSTDGKRCYNFERKTHEAAHDLGINVAEKLWVLAHLFFEIEDSAPPEDRPFILGDIIALIDLARDKMTHFRESGN